MRLFLSGSFTITAALFCFHLLKAQDETTNPNGVFRYDIKNLTTGKVEVENAKSIVYGRYRAYFGHGPAGLYHQKAPHKDFRLMHTSPEQVGQPLDMSRDYKERWEGHGKLIITHTGIAGRREGQSIQRTLSRIPSQSSEIDGAWRVEVKDLTEPSVIAGEHVVVRMGEYAGFFVQNEGAPLHAIYAEEVSPNKYRVLFSTQSDESGSYLNFSKEYDGHWSDHRWVENFVAAGTFLGHPGHRIKRTYSRMPN